MSIWIAGTSVPKRETKPMNATFERLQQLGDRASGQGETGPAWKSCGWHYPYLQTGGACADIVLIPNPDVHCFSDGLPSEPKIPPPTLTKV
jgi:hypothetical protein